MALEENELTEDSTSDKIKVMLTDIAKSLYPIHARRMAFFDTKQKGSPKELARELNSKSQTADWQSFTKDAAVLHLFIQLTLDLDARREASDILKTKPQGDYLLLIEKLQKDKNDFWTGPYEIRPVPGFGNVCMYVCCNAFYKVPVQSKK